MQSENSDINKQTHNPTHGISRGGLEKKKCCNKKTKYFRNNIFH